MEEFYFSCGLVLQDIKLNDDMHEVVSEKVFVKTNLMCKMSMEIPSDAFHVIQYVYILGIIFLFMKTLEKIVKYIQS